MNQNVTDQWRHVVFDDVGNDPKIPIAFINRTGKNRDYVLYSFTTVLFCKSFNTTVIVKHNSKTNSVTPFCISVFCFYFLPSSVLERQKQLLVEKGSWSRMINWACVPPGNSQLMFFPSSICREVDADKFIVYDRGKKLLLCLSTVIKILKNLTY